MYAFVTMNKQGWLTRSETMVGGEGQDAASLRPIQANGQTQPQPQTQPRPQVETPQPVPALQPAQNGVPTEVHAEVHTEVHARHAGAEVLQTEPAS
jgi:hypothetical protein